MGGDDYGPGGLLLVPILLCCVCPMICLTAGDGALGKLLCATCLTPCIFLYCLGGEKNREFEKSPITEKRDSLRKTFRKYFCSAPRAVIKCSRTFWFCEKDDMTRTKVLKTIFSPCVFSCVCCLILGFVCVGLTYLATVISLLLSPLSISALVICFFVLVICGLCFCCCMTCCKPWNGCAIFTLVVTCLTLVIMFPIIIVVLSTLLLIVCTIVYCICCTFVFGTCSCFSSDDVELSRKRKSSVVAPKKRHKKESETEERRLQIMLEKQQLQLQQQQQQLQLQQQQQIQIQQRQQQMRQQQLQPQTHFVTVQYHPSNQFQSHNVDVPVVIPQQQHHHHHHQQQQPQYFAPQIQHHNLNNAFNPQQMNVIPNQEQQYPINGNSQSLPQNSQFPQVAPQHSQQQQQQQLSPQSSPQHFPSFGDSNNNNNNKLIDSPNIVYGM